MTNTSPNPKLSSPHSKLKRQLKSPDLAFNPPLVKSLGGKELGEFLSALFVESVQRTHGAWASEKSRQRGRLYYSSTAGAS
ncbi:hypothetical protein WN943_021706 [Citrus x changshan-huyou]